MSEKISDIKLVFEQAKMDEYPELYKKYESDSRAGVKNLIRKYQKQEEKLEQERARLEQMREYEHCYAACKWICGIDEAGRGPLAGPVVAGAVILPEDCEYFIMDIRNSLHVASSLELAELLYRICHMRKKESWMRLPGVMEWM